MAEIKEFVKPEFEEVDPKQFENTIVELVEDQPSEMVEELHVESSEDNFIDAEIVDGKAVEIAEELSNELEEDNNEYEEVASDEVYNNVYGTKQIDPKESVAADIFIKTITPYKITFKKKDNRDIAIIIFLCRDDYDNLFIIDRNIAIRDQDHLSDLECIPFAEDKDYDFVNDNICTNLLLGHLDNYVCDMKFEISKEDIKSSNPVLTTTLTNVHTRETKVAAIGADTYAALTFIDSYVSEDIINEHDLALAVVAGSKDNTKAEFYVVDSVDKIVAMAPAVVELGEKEGFFAKLKSMIFKNDESDHPTSVGMVIKVSRIVGTEREVVQLLTPFDIGVEFDEDKFKGNTISSIEDNYFGDADQYVTTLTINSARIEGIDKSFMIIRAKSKTGDVKLFLLDSSAQKELQDKINEY